MARLVLALCCVLPRHGDFFTEKAAGSKRGHATTLAGGRGVRATRAAAREQGSPSLRGCDPLLPPHPKPHTHTELHSFTHTLYTQLLTHTHIYTHKRAYAPSPAHTDTYTHPLTRRCPSFPDQSQLQRGWEAWTLGHEASRIPCSPWSRAWAGCSAGDGEEALKAAAVGQERRGEQRTEDRALPSNGLSEGETSGPRTQGL